MDMYQSSPTTDQRSRKNLTLILQRLASTGQGRVAEAIGKDESTVSRMKETHLPLLAGMLAALGLKVVPVGHRCLDADIYKTLKRLAIERLEDDTADKLEWD